MSTTTRTPKITLYRGWLKPNHYVWSPFVTKLEARLRFSNIPYKTDCGSTKSGPRGKIPYVEISNKEHDPEPSSSSSDSGSDIVDDSTLIIKHLVERAIIPDLHSSLSPADKAHDLALRALLENKLCFYNTRERWTENYTTMRDYALSAIPYPFRLVIGYLIHRNTAQTLHGQGTGRFSADEIMFFRREVWENVNALLVTSQRKKGGEGDHDDGRPFWILSGEEPTEADATVFAFIVSVFICTAGPESRKLVMEFAGIREYALRIHDTYFPDYEKWSEE